MAIYLCERVGKDGIWDEVDEYVFTHTSLIVDADDSPRYTGNRASSVSGKIEIHGTFDAVGLGRLMRCLNVQRFDGIVPGGLSQSPEFLRVNIKGKRHIHEVGYATHKLRSA